MSLARRFVTVYGAESAPLVDSYECPISFHYRTRFERRSKPMPNAAKPGRATLLAHPEAAPEAAFDGAEASENAPRAFGSAAPPALPRPSLGVPAASENALPPGGVEPPALPRPGDRPRQALTDPSANGSTPERPATLRTALAEEAREPSVAPSSVAPHPSDREKNPELHASRLSGRLAVLAETAKAYARAAQADNTQRAYSADWRHFASWLRRQGLSETPPDPEAVGLYLASQVERRGAELSVATLERRLSGIAWRYRQLGQPLEIRDRHIATVLAGIRRQHGRPPLQKAAIFADELLAMLATLEMDLRGLRDRAILAIGFAGGLRRSEIVGLDCGPRQTEDGSGWIELFPEGALLTIRGKTGWRDVEIGRGSRPNTCPVALLETWRRLGRIGHGPLFRAIARKNGGVSGARLTDKHVVRLVKTCALAAGLRGDLAEGERRLAFGGHSLRAGLASSAQIEEAHVQKHLGHASAEMTRRYQRKRDRFKVNLTKAAGL
jgi:integrase